MRRLTILFLLVVGVPVASACKKPDAGGDAGADGAASASASATASASASASASATSTATAAHFGPPAPGVGCRPGADTNACAADKSAELTCTGGLWHVMQNCRGPAACTGTGGGTNCDVGSLIPGDVCVPGNPPSRCTRRQAVLQCSGGKWTETVCAPPSFCHPADATGPAGCK
jgi:hypothetical protein